MFELFRLIEEVKKDLADGKLTQAELASLLKKLADFMLSLAPSIPDKLAKIIITTTAGLLDKVADLLAAGKKIDAGYVVGWVSHILADISKLIEAVE